MTIIKNGNGLGCVAYTFNNLEDNIDLRDYIFDDIVTISGRMIQHGLSNQVVNHATKLALVDDNMFDLFQEWNTGDKDKVFCQIRNYVLESIKYG